MAIKEKVVWTPRLWDPVGGTIILCPGCQHGLAGAMVAQVIEKLDVEGRAVVVIGAGCNGGLFLGFGIDGVLAAHGRSPDVATGIKRVHPDSIVFTVQGDGDLLAIGAGPLFGALARGEKITIIMLNNGAYASTGGQLAPTTLMEQITPTTPYGRQTDNGYPVHAAEVIAQFKSVAYSARGALNNFGNYQRTKKYVEIAFQKQIDSVGLSFVEIISACPTQWRMTPLQSLERIEEKVIGEFPLGEFKNVDRLD